MANTLRGFNHTYSASSATSIAGGAFDVDPVAGDAVRVVVVGFENYSVSSVTDNAGGNTYSQVSGTRYYNNGSWCEIWQCDNVNTTSGFAVTANMTGACTSRGICGIAIAGPPTASATDLAGGQTLTGNYSGTDVLTTGSLGTPTSDGQFVIAVATGNAAPDNFAAGTGYTALGSYTYNQIWRVEYKIQSSAAEVFGTFTEDNTYAGGGWALAGCSVKAAAPPATLEQEGYRIRNDDGSESSASWKAAQDTAVSMTLGAARVRVLLDATNDPASKAVGLKYAVNGGQKRSVN